MYTPCKILVVDLIFGNTVIIIEQLELEIL